MLNSLNKIYKAWKQKMEYDKHKAIEDSKIFTKDKLIYSKYTIGEYTYGTPQVIDWEGGGKLKIGKFCSIADNVRILLGGGHRIDWTSTYPFNVLNEKFPNAIGIQGHPVSKGDVIIGNDVWIAYGVTIMSGVVIGDGAVIGAGSLVTRNIEPYTINVGNPANKIRSRFSEEQIKDLLILRWWDLTQEEINGIVHLLCSNRIDVVIQELKKYRNGTDSLLS